jgi:DnaJ domain
MYSSLNGSIHFEAVRGDHPVAKIIVERGSSFWGWARGVLIEVDGKRYAKVPRNGRVEFAIGPGTHTVQARMDWEKSSPIKVVINAKDVVGFKCQVSGNSSVLQISLEKVFHANKARGSKANSEQADRDGRTERRGSDPIAAWSLVLHVSADASIEEIRAAYLKRIGEYHPDKVASLGKEIREVAERKSKEINVAYSFALEERREA